MRTLRLLESTKREVEELYGFQFTQLPNGNWTLNNFPFEMELVSDSHAAAEALAGRDTIQIGGSSASSPGGTKLPCEGCGRVLFFSNPIKGARKLCIRCAANEGSDNDHPNITSDSRAPVRQASLSSRIATQIAKWRSK